MPVFPDPEAETVILATIRAVKAGGLDDEGTRRYGSVVRDLCAARVGALLIACTELSMVALAEEPPCPVVDALDSLVDAIVAAATTTADC